MKTSYANVANASSPCIVIVLEVKFDIYDIQLYSLTLMMDMTELDIDDKYDKHDKEWFMIYMTELMDMTWFWFIWYDKVWHAWKTSKSAAVWGSATPRVSGRNQSKTAAPRFKMTKIESKAIGFLEPIRGELGVICTEDNIMERI